MTTSSSSSERSCGQQVGVGPHLEEFGSSTHQALHLLLVDGTHWGGGDRREGMSARTRPQVGGWLDKGQLVARSGSSRRRYVGHNRTGTLTDAGLGGIGWFGWFVSARTLARDGSGCSRLCIFGRIHRGLGLQPMTDCSGLPTTQGQASTQASTHVHGNNRLVGGHPPLFG